jgi:MoxR-like ATPase
MINIAYLPPAEEQKLVNFDFKQVRLKPLVPKERIIELRSVITREVFLHESLAKYIRRLVGATRPYSAEGEWHQRSPSELVEKCVDLGASPRATITWGRLVKVWALLMHRRSEVYPEDVQELARYILSHRVWLGPHAAEPRRHRRNGDRRHRGSCSSAMRGKRPTSNTQLPNAAKLEV